jgi:hypothetical protein
LAREPAGAHDAHQLLAHACGPGRRRGDRVRGRWRLYSGASWPTRSAPQLAPA